MGSGHLRSGWRAATVCLVALALGGAARATSYSIATTTDGAVNNGNCTLREAIRAANTNLAVDQCPPGGAADVITLPAGTYSFFGGEETLQASTTLEIRGQPGLDPSLVVIDLGGVNRFLHQSGGSLTLRGLLVRFGGTPTAGGGALLVDGAPTLVLDHTIFFNCVAGGRGGAVRVYTDGPTVVEIRSSRFELNAGLESGGAVDVFGFDTVRANVRDTEFVGNTGSEGVSGIPFGAGLSLQIRGASEATLTRCSYDGNTLLASQSGYGGGAYLRASDQSRITMTGNRFTGNGGGAASNFNVEDLYAIVEDTSTILLDRLDISSAEVDRGAFDFEVSVTSYDAASLSLTDSRLRGVTGSGLHAYASGGVLQLGQLTVAGYAGGKGGWLMTNTGQMSVDNSLFVFNTTNLDADPAVSRAHDCPATGFIPGDFVDAGGGDYRLSHGSLARDIGWPSLPTQRANDLDHGPRIVGPLPDCGAYEFGGLFADGYEAGDTGDWSARTP